MKRSKPFSRNHAFTLIELLVVISIIGVLGALLLPSLASAKLAGKKAVCLSNLRQIGIALEMYAGEGDGRIPYGPTAPPFTSPAELYPSTGSPTSLLSLRSGASVGLGLLLDSYLADTPRVLFCPGSDQAVNAEMELEKVGATQSQGSYYYRHAGITQLFYSPASIPPHLQLDNLGTNRSGTPIRAVVIDTQFLCPPELESFNVRVRTHHQRRLSNILYADGSAASRPNEDGRFNVDVRSYPALHDALNRILKVFEVADAEP